MPNAYREIFTAPGTKAFSSAGLMARLPLPLTHMGILTMLSETTGEYALAGLVAGTFTFAMAFLGPQVSKAVDRRGQSRVLPLATGVSVLGLAALLLCATAGAPSWTLFLFALLSGLMPSMSAMVRARWTEIYRGTPQLTTAYSMESVVDELTYVISPALAVVLSTALFPQAAPLFAGLLLLVGVALFVPQKSTEPPVKARVEHAGGTSAIRSAPVLLLALVLLCGGAVPGMVDTMGLAFAEEQGNKSLAGLVFAVYAVGSGLSGLLFGARQPAVPLPRLLLIGVGGTALTTLPFLFVDGVAAMVVVVFFAGVFFAPTMVVIMGIVERTTPEHQLTEAMTWMIAGLQSGVAIGAAVTGVVYDRFGTTAGVSVALAAGAGALLLTLCALPMLRTRLTRADQADQAAKAPAAPAGTTTPVGC
ncbi:MFS transporter [Streptomyces aurantiacus]|uniref:Putative GPI-anchored protein PB15E9.01c n=1 Tax=Streptomyces aurantiacus JA 4570 TaxID=1286094 RepID=S3ZNA7_9ACTN|nr:MFS transporter [Streptomyces aurantiacus]EPH45006.1 putative GPI-anchored protein PB15E9.01c [Streptomyces aurantiacus JA 4570]